MELPRFFSMGSGYNIIFPTQPFMSLGSFHPSQLTTTIHQCPFSHTIPNHTLSQYRTIPFPLHAISKQHLSIQRVLSKQHLSILRVHQNSFSTDHYRHNNPSPQSSRFLLLNAFSPNNISLFNAFSHLLINSLFGVFYQLQIQHNHVGPMTICTRYVVNNDEQRPRRSNYNHHNTPSSILATLLNPHSPKPPHIIHILHFLY